MVIDEGKGKVVEDELAVDFFDNKPKKALPKKFGLKPPKKEEEEVKAEPLSVRP
jgi:hypothetical protein